MKLLRSLLHPDCHHFLPLVELASRLKHGTSTPGQCQGLDYKGSILPSVHPRRGVALNPLSAFKFFRFCERAAVAMVVRGGAVVACEMEDSLVAAEPKKAKAARKSRAKAGCKKPPPRRSAFAGKGVPDEGVERRKALSRIYEQRRKARQDIDRKVAKSAAPGSCLRDEIAKAKNFSSVTDVLRDCQVRVAHELKRVREAGRELVIDFEERETFLKIIQHRLSLLGEDDDA